MATEITQLEDSTVHVKVTMYGIEANGWVSSYHLVGTKERQLQCLDSGTVQERL